MSRRTFVGREPELGALMAGLEDARAGRGRFIAVVGEAGIGKTRTLEEFVSRAGVPDDQILWGRCPEHHGLPAYRPWALAIERYVERCDIDALGRVLGRGASDLAQLVPTIHGRLGVLEASAPCDPDQARLRLFDSIAAFFRRASDAQPLVVVLDDLHWADEGSLLLLAFLAPELRRSRTLLLATYREREMQRSTRLLGEVARVSERITLGGLEVSHVADFIRDAIDAAPGQSMVSRLHRVSQGNPFFLEELVRMLRTSGHLEHDDELGVPLPVEVRQVIHRNLESLSAECRRLLTVASVIGYEFDVARLRVACELASDQVLEQLQSAASLGVVEETVEAGGQFRFAHMLIRDALYGELPPLDRARLHRQVGVALERLYEGARDAPCAELARHFVHAAVLGDAAKALEYSARAGYQAMARLAHEEAARHVEVALKVQRLERPDEARELDLRMMLGQALSNSGDHERARAAFERAAERARVLRDAPTFARAALGYAFATPGTGIVHALLVALLEEALVLLGEADTALRAAVLGSLASALYFSHDEHRRDALSRDAVAMARRVGEADALARTLVQRHHVLWGTGSIADRLALCDEIVRLATEAKDVRLGLQGRLWRLVDLLEDGDVARLDVELETFARGAEHARIPFYRWFAGVVHAVRALFDGRLGDGERLADEAASRWREGPLSLSAQTHALQRFMLALEMGRLAELETTFAELAEAFPAIPAWQSGVALIHAESGRPDEALRVLDAFGASRFTDLPRDAHLLSSLASFAQVAHLVRSVDHAAALYSALLPHAGRNGVVGFGAATYGACTRYLGLLAATMGRLDDSRRHLADALAANARLGHQPLVAHTQYDYACVLLLTHERSKADTLLAEARRTAERLGLARLLERIVRTTAFGADAPSRTASGMFRRDASHWTISYEGRTVRMKDAKGNAYLAMLLRHPGHEIHVLELATGEATDIGRVADPGGSDGRLQRHLSSDAGEVIDAQARAAYKRRLGELQEEVEEAQRFNDLGRAERLRDEMDSLMKELSGAIGLGGRRRKVGSTAERARINVSRAITAVVKKITDEHPALGEHLAARVHTGMFCSYTPDPSLTVEWHF